MSHPNHIRFNLSDGFWGRALTVFFVATICTFLIYRLANAQAAKPSYLETLRPRPIQQRGAQSWSPEQLNVIQAFDLQQKVTANDGVADDNFGLSVAVFGDTAVVGAPGDDIGANLEQGSAYLYTRSGSTWTQQAKLVASDGAAGDGFGIGVAIDNGTVVVGAYTDDNGALTDNGSAYVFTGSGANWTQQAKLVGSGGNLFELFGFSVAVKGDSAAIGAPFNGPGANEQGAVYIFTRSGSIWTQQQTLTATPFAEFDHFGDSVSISGDTVIGGALSFDANGNFNQGAAYVFTRSGATWTQQAQLLANDGAANDRFGISVGLSGNSAIVGANGDDIGANPEQGSAYVFTRSGANWTQQAKLTASDGARDDDFGTAVAIDADTAVVGAPNRGNIQGQSSGAGGAYTYSRSGANWSQDPVLVAADGALGDALGLFVAVQGTALAIGAPSDMIGTNFEQGSAYLYGIGGPRLTISDVSLNEGNSGTTNANFTVTLSQPAPGSSFSFATADGTATVSDYNATNGTITFVNNATSANISVAVRGDNSFEPDETFFVNLSNPTGGVTLGDGQGQGTILNDDTPPTISINDINVNEGNSGTTPATFNISLSSRSGFPVTVNYATVNGTAEAGTDYQAVRSTDIVIPAGALSQPVTVDVFGDTLTEPDETFTVSLQAVTGGTIADNEGRATIINDDGALPLLQFTAATTFTSETNAGVSVEVQRLGDVTSTVSVDYGTTDNFNFVDCAVANGIAHQRCDYIASYGTLTFGPGEASKSIIIPIVDDLEFEAPSESFSLSLSNPTGAIIGTNATTTITISENDSSAITGNGFLFRLTGGQVVPGTSSVASGLGRATLNASETILTINNLFLSNFSSTQIFTSLNGPAQENANGAVIVTLPPGNLSNLTVSLNPTQVEQLKKGLLYLSVATMNFPNGEIRGHLLSNPLESARFFVREQYFDFLNRVPDQAGFDFWTGQIANTCGVNLACVHTRRLDVSAAFFVEQEFQESGAYVFRLYKAAFGEATLYRPAYAAFVPDRARVVGSANLAQGKLNFANLFASRMDFINRYPTSMTPAQLVDAILLTVQQGAGISFTASERTAFINTVTTNGRGTFLRDLGDNLAFRNTLFNRAFVLTQYFGYLKRDPDQAGYDFWLNTINGQPQNIRGMVCAFVTSAEYQQRFSPVASRSNADCQ